MIQQPIILAIDFDHTIADVDFPVIKGFKPNAKHYINLLYEEGFYISVWTCRSGMHKDAAEDFLNKEGVNFHCINENHPILIEHWGETRKLAADIYIDDKQLGGIPEDWALIYQLIHKHSLYFCDHKKLLNL